MAEHFERNTPGMHTSDTLDYGAVIHGEMILELDDGKTVDLRQGDCIVKNGTRHRWRNPYPNLAQWHLCSSAVNVRRKIALAATYLR